MLVKARAARHQSNLISPKIKASSASQVTNFEKVSESSKGQKFLHKLHLKLTHCCCCVMNMTMLLNSTSYDEAVQIRVASNSELMN